MRAIETKGTNGIICVTAILLISGSSMAGPLGTACTYQWTLANSDGIVSNGVGGNCPLLTVGYCTITRPPDPPNAQDTIYLGGDRGCLNSESLCQDETSECTASLPGTTGVLR